MSDTGTQMLAAAARLAEAGGLDATVELVAGSWRVSLPAIELESVTTGSAADGSATLCLHLRSGRMIDVPAEVVVQRAGGEAAAKGPCRAAA